MTASWGPSPWRLELDLPRRAPPERCDVAVVGGGLVGLATALRLARRGIDTALFEAEHIGAGASGRTGGLVLEDSSAGPLEGLGPCIPALERLIADADIDCELALPGCWELVHDGRAPLWRDGEQSLSIESTVAGGSLDAGRLLGGLAGAAVSSGAVLCERARVDRIEPDGLWIGSSRVAAGIVCVTLNAYTRELVAIEDEFATALTLALLTEPLGRDALAELGLADGHVFYTTDLPYLWGRPLRDRLLAGGGLAFDPEGRLERIDVRSGEVAERLDRLALRIRGLHPALSRVDFERRWGGPVAFRRARVPILCRLEDGGGIVTGGYAGHGVALAARLGELIAAAVADGRPLPDWGSCRLGSRTLGATGGDRA